MPADFIHCQLSLLEQAIRIIAFGVDIFENGITIPAELILWVFGWAAFQDCEPVAPFKWYNCFFPVAVFVIGLHAPTADCALFRLVDKSIRLHRTRITGPFSASMIMRKVYTVVYSY